MPWELSVSCCSCMHGVKVSAPFDRKLVLSTMILEITSYCLILLFDFTLLLLITSLS